MSNEKQSLQNVEDAAGQQPALGAEHETLAWLVDNRSAHVNDPRGWAHGYTVIELVDRAHVARLQAEVESLKEESFEPLYNAVIDERDAALAHTAELEGLLRRAAAGLRQWKSQVAPRYEGEDALLAEIDAALAEGAKS